LDALLAHFVRQAQLGLDQITPREALERLAALRRPPHVLRQREGPRVGRAHGGPPRPPGPPPGRAPGPPGAWVPAGRARGAPGGGGAGAWGGAGRGGAVRGPCGSASTARSPPPPRAKCRASWAAMAPAWAPYPSAKRAPTWRCSWARRVGPSDAYSTCW